MKSTLTTKLFLFFLLVPQLVWGQVNENLKRYHIKKNVEKVLLDDIESLIKTKLSDGTFQVNLKVKLRDIEETEERLPATEDSQDIADNLRIKLFDLQRIIDAYKTEESSETKEEGFPEIERVDVLVGLSEFYESSFRNKFQTWFTTMAQERIGDVRVSYSLIGEPVKPDPNKNEDKPEEDDENKKELENLKDELKALERKMEEELNDINRGVIEKIADVKDDLKDELSKVERMPSSLPQKTTLDHFKDLQNFIGWLLFGVLMFLGITYLSKNLRPLIETRNENINQKQGEDSASSDNEEEKSSEDDDFMDESASYDDMEMDAMSEPLSPIEHMALSLAHDQANSLPQLFDFWMEGSMIDRKKFWALISLCFRSDMQHPVHSTVIPQIQTFINNRNIEWSEDSFKSIRDKKADELASSVYNDLVRMKTFGVESFRVRLSALQGLSGQQIIKLINHIGEEDIILLFLSSEQKKIYLNSLSESKKASVLHSSMNMLEVSDQKLAVLEKKVEEWLANFRENGEVKVLNLVGKIKETFKALSLEQKLKYIDQLKSKSLNSYEGLCRSHFNPLWFHNLSERLINECLNLLEYNETLYLAALNVENKNEILNLSAPRLQRMLEEENFEALFEKIVHQDAQFQGVDEQVTEKILSYLEQKNIMIEDAYEFSEEPGMSSAA